MRRFGLFLPSIILIAAAQAFAADDAVTRAMKLYEKRHYGEAASMLRAANASVESGKKGAANLALGMIYFKNAVLHRELYQAAVVASQDYLKKLSAAQGKDRSRFVDLYFGQALAESGKPGAAAIYLKKFSANGGVEPRYQAIAKISLALGYSRNNEPAKATELWRGIDASDPEVKAELAAAFSKAGLVEQEPISYRRRDSLRDEGVQQTPFDAYGEEPCFHLCPGERADREGPGTARCVQI